MPVVTISVKLLNNLLINEYPMKTLTESLEQLGCDVEDTVEIALYRCPACDALNDKLAQEDAVKRCTFCGCEDEYGFEKHSSDSAIRIDLLANRPDLFNVSGLARALRGYLNLEQGLPSFDCLPGNLEVHVDPSTSSIRPYIVCAEINIPPLDHSTLRELMKLQENLHWGIGRDRKLASIGIYDLDSLKPPIYYKTVDPTGFKFHPLGIPDVEMTPKEILENHPKGKAYSHLLEKLPRYPLLVDSTGKTLSMPPIINSEETKCKINTSRLFIDVTGIGEQAVNDALNVLCCAIAEFDGKIHSVKIITPDNSFYRPDLTPKSIDVSIESARRLLGIPLTTKEFMNSILKMRLNVQACDKIQGSDLYSVEYPVFRSDIRHEVDVIEDILIGYGLDRIPMKLVPTMTVASERPEEKLNNTLRSIMTGLGYTEIMSLNLNSEENTFTRLRLTPGENFVLVENPKTLLQRVLRCHLMSGIMETLEKNRKKIVPQRIFEIGPVTVINPDTEIGVSEFRHLSFAVIGPETGYAEGRSILDSILFELGYKGKYRSIEHPTFIEGRCAEVTVPGSDILWAQLGEIHPQVLTNFNLAYPMVFCELRFACVYPTREVIGHN